MGWRGFEGRPMPGEWPMTLASHGYHMRVSGLHHELLDRLAHVSETAQLKLEAFCDEVESYGQLATL